MDQTPPPVNTGAPFEGGGAAPTSEEKTWAMFPHLGIILGLIGLIATIVIWQIKKEESKYITYHAKEALNFQITLIIAMIGVAVLSWVLIMIMPILAFVSMLGYLVIGIGGLVLAIIAGIAANGGKMHKYPFNLRLIK